MSAIALAAIRIRSAFLDIEEEAPDSSGSSDS